jgi:hypothetical protein
VLDLIFRHRARMQVVYGRVEAPSLAGERFSKPQPRPPGPLPKRPGQIGTRGKAVVAIPMPKRVRKR